jgi:glycosyltransferase involved in cell wall biosynthesis
MSRKMRVLWFSDILLPDAATQLGRSSFGTGWWKAALADELKRIGDIELAVCTAVPGATATNFVAAGIRCYLIPEPRASSDSAIARALSQCADVVRGWNPDLLHYHGTEGFYSLLSARNLTAVPSVISLQGLMGPCSRWPAFFGDAGPLRIAQMHRWVEPLIARGLIWTYARYRRQAVVEREVISTGNTFLGRTEWDRAYVRSLNPSARYCTVGELLRREFWEQPAWSIDCAVRHRIVFSNAGQPRKGVETLLESLDILQQRYPDVHLQLCGTISARSGYGRYLRRRVHSYGGVVSLLGHLEGPQLAQVLRSANVFASASFIDNSPNSVCEAMLVGVPCVCSYTGGTPSLLEHGRSGLFVPPGDPEMLAERIASIFDNDKLACRLGATARITAIERHDPALVMKQLLDAYSDALACPDDLSHNMGVASSAISGNLTLA